MGFGGGAFGTTRRTIFPVTLCNVGGGGGLVTVLFNVFKPIRLGAPTGGVDESGGGDTTGVSCSATSGFGGSFAFETVGFGEILFSSSMGFLERPVILFPSLQASPPFPPNSPNLNPPGTSYLSPAQTLRLSLH